ncbi:MAG TPA: hypothetical protein VJH24_04700 [Candidatus Bilamarchaeaceae archaeon]|nr:hypothetical protein [Candidatus Bilamarchaeaceae archaeon]
MPELTRNVRCMNCGNERSVHVSTDMQISELLLHGKCLGCNSSIQVSFSLVGDQPPTGGTGAGSTSEGGMVNLDETLFEPELSDNALKDIIED